MEKKYLTKKEAASYITNEVGLPVHVGTLSRLIWNGKGPKYHKFGHRVVYEKEHIDEWINSRLSIAYSNIYDQYKDENERKGKYGH